MVPPWITGNTQIVLCERGIRTFAAGEYCRFTLDLNAVQAAREATDLPVIVDPSHATGDAELVPWAARAAIGCGAQGLIIEVISEGTPRSEVLCDARQGIRPSVLGKLIAEIRAGIPEESVPEPKGIALAAALPG